MQAIYFGDDDKYVKLTADDGYKLTTYNEETDAVEEFAAFSIITCLSEKKDAFHEIDADKATELEAQRDAKFEEERKKNEQENRVKDASENED